MINYRHLGAVFFIVGAGSFLYIPYLGNSLVFDDYGIFSSSLYDISLFNFSPRNFPYFTLAFFHVLSGDIAVNRMFSLCLHVACCLLLFLLLKELLQRALETTHSTNVPLNARTIYVVAAFSCTWYVVHPIAVYGAAYLAQRTILFATLFSLSSLWFYRRALAENRTSDVVSAAIFYSLAVFSKEHAIMLPLAAVALTSLYSADFRSSFQRISLYLFLCLPAAVTVYFAAKTVVTVSYEPDVASMILRMHDIPIMAKSWGPWLVSMVMQAGLFFDYLFFWIVPDIRYLSADIRFDFVSIWFSWLVFPRVVLFLLAPILAIYFLRKKGIVALFCCGFLYCWFLFMTELVSVRFQEPFVLYRSYLWAPGYVMMLAAVLATIRPRWLNMLAVPILLVLLLLARDRLTSLETEANVWKDAAKKLSSPTILGSDRIFYNRGRAYLQEKKYKEAIDDFSQVVQLSPKIWQAYYNRAIAFYALKKDAEALQDLDLAASINQRDSSTQYVRAMIFERSGCMLAANKAYSESLKLGYVMASMKLDALAKNPLENDRHLSPAIKCPT